MTLQSVPKSSGLVLSRAVPATAHVPGRLTGSLSCNLRHPQRESLRPTNIHELAAGASYSEEPSPRVPV